MATQKIETALIADDAVTSAKIGTLDANLEFGDSVKAIFGASSDLQIYHDGSNSYIDDTATGHLFIRSNGDGIYLRSNTNEEIAHFNVNGSVKSYYDNSLKLATTSTGIDVTGNIKILDGYIEFDKPSVYGFRFLQNDAGNDLSIQQGDANNANYVTRLNIGSSGNVGIGTTSPTAPLSIRKVHATGYGSGIDMLDFKAYYPPNYDSETSKASIFVGTSDKHTLNTHGGYLAFKVNQSGFSGSSATNLIEAMRIEKDGKVGIGTDSPSTKLTIKNDSNNTSVGDNNIITIQNASTTDNSRMGLAFTGNTGIGSGLAVIDAVSYDQSHGKTSLNFSVYSGSWHNDMMVLKEGNVAIGSTSDALANMSGLFRILDSTGGDRTVAHFGAHNYGDTGKTFINIGTEYGDGTSRIGSFNDTGNKSVLVFDTHSATSGQFTERMRIHSNGNVTKPTQCNFLARRNGNQTGYNASGSYGDGVRYNSEIYDIGGDFDVTTGIFTAPVDGTYLIQGSVYSTTAGTNWSQAWLAVNGARAEYTDMVTADGNTFISTTHLVKLSAGDEVRYHPYYSGSSSVTIIANNNHTWFKGYLLG